MYLTLLAIGYLINTLWIRVCINHLNNVDNLWETRRKIVQVEAKMMELRSSG